MQRAQTTISVVWAPSKFFLFVFINLQLTFLLCFRFYSSGNDGRRSDTTHGHPIPSSPFGRDVRVERRALPQPPTVMNNAPPAPAPRAAARRVDHGWNDHENRGGRETTTTGGEPDATTTTTRPQPHEHLLVGWMMGGMVTLEGERGGSQVQIGRRRRMAQHPHAYEPLLIGWIACRLDDNDDA
jgi:hypothetical protein